MTSSMLDERGLVERAVEKLVELLGPDFDVGPGDDRIGEQLAEDVAGDAVYTVRARDISAYPAHLVIEAKNALTPAEVRQLLAPRMRLLSRLYDRATMLVVSPWLSPRTREALATSGISSLDLTGNVDLRLPPGVLIRTEGMQHNPLPQTGRRGRGLTGAAAGIITRILVDFAPPYRQKDIATIAGVSAGYVSRIMQTLEDEALLRRDGSDITHADWQGLLRARAGSTDLLRVNSATPMVARKGSDSVYRALFTQETRATAFVTGSYAAREVAPIAVGGQLMIYTAAGPHDLEELADEFSLLPAAGTTGNVLVLQPPNRGPFARPRHFGSSYHVGLSQLAIDCMSGPGRMPAEGEAVLARMVETEDTWRREPGRLAAEAAAGR